MPRGCSAQTSHERAAAAERARPLSRLVVGALAEAGLLRMDAPRSPGGLKEDAMADMQVGGFDQPKETLTFPKGRYDVVKVGGQTVARALLEPGWRFSVHVKEVTGAELCMDPHVLYVATGRIMVSTADGSEGELGTGAVAIVPAGHDAWVVGDELCTLVEFGDWSAAPPS